MPKQVDHDGRRAEIAAALWQVVARDGIDAVTIRNVAAQARVSPGRVQHYFAAKDDMIRFALERVSERFAARLTERISRLGSSAAPREIVRTVLVERLPVDPEQRAYVQALLAWLMQATRDRSIESSMIEGTQRLRDYVANLLHDGGSVDPDSCPHIAAGLLAMTDGLISHVMQGILAVDTATTIIDENLDLLFTPTNAHQSSPT